jgi:hypothetical protein
MDVNLTSSETQDRMTPVYRAQRGITLLMLVTVIAVTAPAFCLGPSSDPLQTFLQEYLKQPGSTADSTTRYTDAAVDLNGDGKSEFIVYISGQGWCGSGGCPTLIIQRDSNGFKLVTKVFITRPPIRVLDTSSHGWRDITVWVEGGGIQPGYEAVLKFDGKGYPQNPSTEPAQPIKGTQKGKTVIESGEVGKPLYD